MSQITHFCGVKLLAWKSGCVKFLTNSMSGGTGRVSTLELESRICLHCASHKLGSHFQWLEFNGIPLVLKCVWPAPTCCWEQTISQGHQKWGTLETFEKYLWTRFPIHNIIQRAPSSSTKALMQALKVRAKTSQKSRKPPNTSVLEIILSSYVMTYW